MQHVRFDAINALLVLDWNSSTRTVGKSAKSIKDGQLNHAFRGNVVICQDCGRENPDEFKFCSKCGKEIIKPLPLGDSKLKVHRDGIRKVILQRKSTDTVISPMWVILLVAIVIVMTLASIGMIVAAAVDLVRAYPSG